LQIPTKLNWPVEESNRRRIASWAVFSKRRQSGHVQAARPRPLAFPATPLSPCLSFPPSASRLSLPRPRRRRPAITARAAVAKVSYSMAYSSPYASSLSPQVPLLLFSYIRFSLSSRCPSESPGLTCRRRFLIPLFARSLQSQMHPPLTLSMRLSYRSSVALSPAAPHSSGPNLLCATLC
jgi:hypothetical protein